MFDHNGLATPPCGTPVVVGSHAPSTITPASRKLRISCRTRPSLISSANLKAKGVQTRIHRRAARNRPLSERQKSANTTRAKVRARVEHVFGQQQNSMGGKIVRTIGIVRARFKIGMMNLGYNIRRLVQLEWMAAAPA